MNKGRYKHMSMLDLQMDIQKVVFEGDDYISARVLWWNPLYNIVCFPETERVTIYRKDFWKWKKV